VQLKKEAKSSYIKCYYETDSFLFVVMLLVKS